MKKIVILFFACIATSYFPVTSAHYGDRSWGPTVTTAVYNTVPSLVKRMKKSEDSLGAIEKLLTEIQNSFGKLSSTTEQYHTEANQIKEETSLATQKAEETNKSSREERSRLEDELKKIQKAFEDYREEVKRQAEAGIIHKKRRERLYDAFLDIFDQGEIQDQIMIGIFARASELSSEFKELFEDLKTIPNVRRAFKAKAYQLENLFWDILNENEELEELIDQPTEYLGIGYYENELLFLDSEPHKEL